MQNGNVLTVASLDGTSSLVAADMIYVRHQKPGQNKREWEEVGYSTVHTVH